MPTKRRVIIFLIVLSVMLLAKRLFGQDAGDATGWDPQHCWDCYADEARIYGLFTVIYAPVCGVIAGVLRVRKRNAALHAGTLYHSGMVSLGL